MNKVVKVGLICCVLMGLCGLGVAIKYKKPGYNSELIVFHAGSLSVPFKQMCEEFNRLYPDVRIIREAAGSRVCARKITDLGRSCDVMASADYTVIDTLLIPEYAPWNIKFARNEMIIAFRRDSRRADEINKDNWPDILLSKNVVLGRADPNYDPCGYRSVIVAKLAERYYDRTGLAEKILAKSRRYIRPKEVDLLALLEVGDIDYIFIYRSVAEQHKLEYIFLPDEINLGKEEFAHFYESVSVRISGKKPGTFVTKTGAPIIYSLTIPRNAPNRETAKDFLTFVFDADKGKAVLTRNGQRWLEPSLTNASYETDDLEILEVAKDLR
jgi:molybdate/tungstate transport system substrate-binding protein